MNTRANKELDRTKGASVNMKAPFAVQFRRSADSQWATMKTAPAIALALVLACHISARADDSPRQDAGCPQPPSCSQAIQVSEVVEAVAPPYPPEVLKLRVMGEVQLAATLTAEGTVEKVEVCRGSVPLLVEAGREALLRWRFARDPEAETPRVAMVSFRFSIDLGREHTVFKAPDRIVVVARARPIE